MEVFHPSRKRVAPEQRHAAHAEHIRYRAAWEATLEEDARRLFAAEGDTVAAHIAAAPDTASAARVLEALPVEPWQRLLRTAYSAVMDDFAQRTLGGLR
jgi:hypothetical protein